MATSQPQQSAQTDAEKAREWETQRDIILRLLPPTATLIAVCLAGVSLFGVHPKLAQRQDTLVDDLLAFNAVLFIVSLQLTLWAVRSRSPSRALSLSYWVENLFLVGVTAIGVAALTMLYTVI